jgi:hypothetical protein
LTLSAISTFLTLLQLLPCVRPEAQVVAAAPAWLLPLLLLPPSVLLRGTAVLAAVSL